MTSRKAQKEAENKDFIDMDEVSKEAQGIIDKVVKDVGKSSATRQLIIGSASGWVTGYLMMKVGKVAAVAIGGGIILLQVANHNGYVNINWDKIFKQAEKVSDKIESKTTAKGPNLFDKVERFVDRKLDKAETLLKKRERKARRWYHRALFDEDPFIFQEIHVFMASFVAGMAFGMIFGGITR
ncbi:hypothetical protein LSTR_LSTR010337 [Laodelphax striatellus]|uniref:FUN14 domain-containing protein 1 n=1 Tax=Laodelphax striatellus TaxID=195883 RepID=A0A482X0K7_LAOST|nr:hypothetical protein LSTR_LSTR010337 [Laodelphax striatellus]